MDIISVWEHGDNILTYIIFNMIDLSLFESKIYSQNGEDGATIKLLETIYDGNNDNKYYVEFGVENGIECNTRILRERYNWHGYVILQVFKKLILICFVLLTLHGIIKKT